MLELTLRRDGSSNFGRNNQYAYFPSVSAGWTLTNEPFMENKPGWFDFLKVRGSWGQNGNEKIGSFGYTTTMTGGNNYSLIVRKRTPSDALSHNLPNADRRERHYW